MQIDEVAVAILCDPAAREKVKQAGEDPDRLVDLYIGAINEAVKGKPSGMTIGVHVCRGNYKGMYLSEGGYDSVAEKFFGAHERRPLPARVRYAARRRLRAAALRAEVQGRGARPRELQDAAAREASTSCERRADEAAKYVDASRLAISPQCGFASTMGGNPVTEADERAKLKLCVDAARAIWG